MPFLYKFLQKLFGILFFVAIIAGAAYILLNSRTVSQYAVPRLLNKQIPDFIVSDFKIEEQMFRWPGKLSFEGVSFSLTDGRNFYAVSVPKIVIEGEPLFWHPRKNIAVKVERMKIENPELKVKGVTLAVDAYFDFFQLEALKGNAFIESLGFKEYELSQIYIPVIAYKGQFKSEPLRANFFDSKILGKIILDYANDMSYIMEMNVEDLDLRQLEGSYPILPENVKGRFTGDLLAKGHQGKMDSLRVDFTAPDGGEMKAALLNQLIQYIPAEARTKEFDLAVKSNGDIFFERMAGQLFSLTKERMTMKIDLESRRLNLKPRITIDFNVEGGLDNFFKHFQDFSN